MLSLTRGVIAVSQSTNIKRIVVCSDGTGQAGGVLNPSNVWRVYQALNKEAQSCFHDDGVGSGGNKIVKVVGGAFGFGISRNLKQIYRFLINQYEPDKENQLYLFGFSRGAYTVRVLAQMVCMFGVPNMHGKSPDEIDEACRMILRSYKAANIELKEDAENQRKLDERELGETESPAKHSKERYVAKSKLADDISQQYSSLDASKKVQFLGVWDTVEAMGLPIDEFTQAFNFFFPLKFTNNRPHPNIDHIYHALSIDEERRTFNPKLFDESGEEKKITAASVGEKLDHTYRIHQVWFPGCHAHVGGGYAKDQLAFNALVWMIKRAQEHQLIFNQNLVEEFRSQAAFDGLYSDSRTGPRMLYRYGPRDIEKLCTFEKGECVTPVLHESAIKRIAYQVDGYSPSSLGFSDLKRRFLVDGNRQLVDPFHKKSGKNVALLLDGLNNAKNLTRSRIAIFYCMFFTLLFTVFWGSYTGWSDSASASHHAWIASHGWQGLIVNAESAVLNVLDSVTPDFADFFFRGFFRTPGAAFVLTTSFLFFFIADKLAIRMIRERSAEGWKSFRVFSDYRHGGGNSENVAKIGWLRWLYLHPVTRFACLQILCMLGFWSVAYFIRNESFQDRVANSSWLFLAVVFSSAIVWVTYKFVLLLAIEKLIEFTAIFLNALAKVQPIAKAVNMWRFPIGPIVGFVVFIALLVWAGSAVWDYIQLLI